MAGIPQKQRVDSSLKFWKWHCCPWYLHTLNWTAPHPLPSFSPLRSPSDLDKVIIISWGLLNPLQQQKADRRWLGHFQQMLQVPGGWRDHLINKGIGHLGISDTTFRRNFPHWWLPRGRATRWACPHLQVRSLASSAPQKLWSSVSKASVKNCTLIALTCFSQMC